MPPRARSDRKPLVLVIDDDSDIRALFQTVLGTDFRVEVAEDGWTALQRLANKSYDVIVLDMAMPQRSGLAVLADIRKDRRASKTPVLVVSAVDPDNELWAGVASEWDRYLQKPVSIQDLVDNVSELAAGKRRKRVSPRKRTSTKASAAAKPTGKKAAAKGVKSPPKRAAKPRRKTSSRRKPTR